MNTKLLGGILLVVGTTIGAGMLALPVATAQLGFWGSVILLIACWAIMTSCSFVFLEVNLLLPAESNLVSMAGATLGIAGQATAWIFYLLLLYSILSAYIAGGGDLFHYILTGAGFNLPLWLASLIFTILFGSVVYLGIRAVDYVNRGLMSGKLGAFIVLALLITPFITNAHLDQGTLEAVFKTPGSISVTAVSFACLLIIPSLRSYFGADIQSLRKAIFFGTLIPLVCYIAWDAVIMGVIPLNGTPGLTEISRSSSSNSDLVAALSFLLNKESITLFAKFFTSICMATSFLSVSLSLSDFLADGLQVAKKGIGNLVIFTATFLPPIVIVLFYPDAFLRGLKYAGVSVFILMVLLPPLMAWRGRYHHDLHEHNSYRVRGGKFLLALLSLFAVLMIAFDSSKFLFIVAAICLGMLADHLYKTRYLSV